MTNDTNISQSETEILIEREFDAPRPMVWRAFTDAGQLGSWWGPTGFTTETHELQVAPGGRWRFVMRGPDGQSYENLITYLEVEEPARLVYRHGGDSEVEPVDFSVHMTLVELDSRRTKVSMRMVFPSKAAKDLVIRTYGAIDGARQNMQSLADHLATAQAGRDAGGVLVIRRVFDAPPSVVWQAWTDSDQLLAWFHPKAWRLSVCELDLRAGGSHFYGMSADDAPPMYGLWQIRRVQAPNLIEFVVSFCDARRQVVRAPFDPHWPLEVLTTITIEPHAGRGGGTVLTMRGEPINANEQERAAFARGIASMTMGWGQTFDSLVEHLAGRSREQTET